ncbi:hypothetical protein ACNPM8_11895 [Glutamicibacter sp. AGC46]
MDLDRENPAMQGYLANVHRRLTHAAGSGVGIPQRHGAARILLSGAQIGPAIHLPSGKHHETRGDPRNRPALNGQTIPPSVLHVVEIQSPICNTGGVQKTSRSSRALRGTAAAFFATFVSLASHVLAGGAIPDILNVALPLSLSLMVCILLSSKRFTFWRLSIMVGFSQVLFHLLFSMGAGHSALSSAGQGIHAHHGMSLAVDATGSASTAMAIHGDGTMLLAHFLAGFATVLVLHRSEQLLIAASDIISLFTWKLFWRLVNFAVQPVRPQPVPAAPRDIPGCTVAVYATSVVRRGPPAQAKV